jgi:hypothetical protein
LPQNAVARSLARVVADLAARHAPLCCGPVVMRGGRRGTVAGRGAFLNMGSGAFGSEGPEPNACAPLKKFCAGLLDAPSCFGFY